MGDIKLLDCTLRDGGYLNDWKFGQANLITVFERLVDAGIDIIEIGFLDERRPFDIDRSIMPDTKSVEQIFGGLEKKQAMAVGMIDYGTCSLENLMPCSESFLDGIRVIFKKHLMHEAMDFCREVKKLGYKVFSQLVSITSYNDDELMELIELVNEVKPYAVSMVDTYGLLYPEDMLHYYQILDEYVDMDVRIGFHGHNNLQLAYANSMAFLNKEAQHDIIVDGTLYGMGKNAGNAPLELLCMRLNEKCGKNYKIDALLEAIQENILDFYAKTPWGYKVFFYLCSLHKCHPNYFSYFEGKKNLSYSKMDDLLSRISPEDKKLLYDKLTAEKIYSDYLKERGSDAESGQAFKEEISDRELLIIGPGKNIQLQIGNVERYIREKHPYTVSINYIPDQLKVNCVFITKSNRYRDMVLAFRDPKNSGIKTLATTNIECRSGSFDFVVNRAPLLEKDEKFEDNSFLMLLKFLQGIEGLGRISCAGFDGYSDKESNYYNPAMEYLFVKQEASYLNRHMKKRISEFRESMDIRFITYSAYDEEEDIYSASI